MAEALGLTVIELGISRPNFLETETRSGEHSYTDLVLAGLLAQQGRGEEAAEWATGAVQSAAGLWARCLSVATSDHEAVNPEVLGAIGFDLAVVGEHVSVLQVDATGRVALLRASSWNISGNPDPRSWMYDVSLSAPTGTHTRVVSSDGVLHVRYLPDNRTPWRGVAPWKRSPSLSKLAAEVEAALIREVRLPTKILITLRKARTSTGARSGQIFKTKISNSPFRPPHTPGTALAVAPLR